MDVQRATMTVPWGEASTAYFAYRKAIAENRATRDDKTLYAALKRLLRGKTVIDLTRAIGEGGVDSRERPRLAIARADAEWCHAWSEDGRVHFSHVSRWTSTRVRGRVSVPVSAFAPATMRGLNSRAQMPLIPPQFRPKGDVSQYHVLFEAEWDPVPPVDPLLLKHIDGPFYVVCAAWNLSPLEQAILRQRL